MTATERDTSAGGDGLEWVRTAWDSRGVPLWRRQTDAIHAGLAARWLPRDAFGTLLKTDLFEEFVSDGLLPQLAPYARQLIGIDISPAVVAGAAARHPGLDARVADVRSLPLEDASIDAIVSTSTLDHFSAAEDVARALRELRRVLRPGGRLLLTLDNAFCLPVTLRHLMPAPVARAVMRTRFDRGWTCGHRRLSRLLSDAGFEVRELSGVLHFPRVAVDLADRVCTAHPRGHRLRERALRLAISWERLERTPARFVTGHYVAVLANVGPGQ